eukprot:CAMPEP_0204581348 /NCGR_PEP_ID=MMETSP0661-20131031/44592_1 /ASSEMBLY_ACC=CAM_ASM_000606 /TAXON_ID=109239 /ORGANISM="Alexandrium margalefi, Strain AMGDE01CS-322" /LENGTH=242 /DNA_ID=CAMNT_0051590527 /DNA_START=65 /DNA_END=793 /DNA_ORIENTATION=-
MSLYASFAQPPRALAREEAREVDKKAEDLGMIGIMLMENAGLGLTHFVLQELERRGAQPGAVVGIVGGRGNNAGDGFVLARHLVLRGFVPKVAFCGDRAKAKRDTDAGVNLTVIERSGVSIEDVLDGPQLAAVLAKWSDAVVLVDAMLGTGLTGELREDYKAWIEVLNAAPQPKIAVDIPSGLDCDTGRPLGAAVKAACTVTFVGRKLGFDQPGAEEYTGPVHVVPIGCPAGSWAHVPGAGS